MNACCRASGASSHSPPGQAIEHRELVGDAAVHQRAPHRLGDLGRQAFGGRGRLDLGDHVFDPGFVADLLAGGLQARGGVHVALPLGQQGHQRTVERVDPGAHLGHPAAALRKGSGLQFARHRVGETPCPILAHGAAR